MDTLPTECIMLIFNMLPLPDKRQFTMCNKFCSKIDIVAHIDKFTNILRKSHILNTKTCKNNLHILELVYYGYPDKIPDTYYCEKNTLLHFSPEIYFICGARKYTDMYDKMLRLKKAITKKWYNIMKKYNITNHDFIDHLELNIDLMIRNYIYGIAYGGHVDLMKNVMQTIDIVKLFNHHEWDFDICCYAAYNGHIYFLEYMLSNGYPQLVTDDEELCNYAAKNNQLETLQWAYKNNCYRDQYSLCGVAGNGHLDILKWAYANGFKMHHNALYDALRGNHLDTVKWLYTQGFGTGSWCVLPNTDIDTARWIYDSCHQHCEYKFNNLDTEYVNFDFFYQIHKHGCPWYHNPYYTCTAEGDLELLKVFHKHNIISDDNMCDIYGTAISHGHTHIVDWVNTQYKCDAVDAAKLMILLANSGNLDALKYMWKKYSQWNPLIYDDAAKNGHLDVLEWAYENGCPISTSATDCVYTDDKLDILKWLHKRGFPIGNHFLSYAVSSGSVEILKFLSSLSDPKIKFDSIACFDAAFYDNIECFEYLLDNGATWTDGYFGGGYEYDGYEWGKTVDIENMDVLLK